jgi:DNA polymerase III epsilon subunit-like protein
VKVIVLDTEMSGSEKDDRIVSLAMGEYTSGVLQNINSGMFNPGVPISQGAFWVHKISDNTIANMPRFVDTPFYHQINELFSNAENIIIGHAICNDLFMIAREGIHCKCKIIDTQFCVTKILKTEKSSLNFLSRELNLLENFPDKEVKLHTAVGDVIVTTLLLNELLKYQSFDELITMTMKPFYELQVKGNGANKPTIFNLAQKNKKKLLNLLPTTKDQRTFYALIYFYENIELYKNKTRVRV